MYHLSFTNQNFALGIRGFFLILVILSLARPYDSNLELLLQQMQESVSEGKLSQSAYELITLEINPLASCDEVLELNRQSSDPGISSAASDWECPGGLISQKESPTKTKHKSRFYLEDRGKFSEVPDAKANWAAKIASHSIEAEVQGTRSEMQRRRIRLGDSHWGLHAGNFLNRPEFRSPDFIRGKNGFGGQQSRVASNELLFAQSSQLNGIGWSYQGTGQPRGFSQYGFATWNQNTLSGKPLDAIDYGGGTRLHSSLGSAELHLNWNRFEFDSGLLDQYGVGGLRLAMDRQKISPHYGYAQSMHQAPGELNRNSSGRGWDWGWYHELGVRESGRDSNYSALLYQGSSQWKNPLMRTSNLGVAQEDGSHINYAIPGQGGFLFKSHRPLGKSFGYRSNLGLAWNLSPQKPSQSDLAYILWAKQERWRLETGLDYAVNDSNEYVNVKQSFKLEHLGIKGLSVHLKHGKKFGHYSGSVPEPFSLGLLKANENLSMYTELSMWDLKDYRQRFEWRIQQAWRISRVLSSNASLSWPLLPRRLLNEPFLSVRISLNS